MDDQLQMVKTAAKVIKKRFPHLTTEETIDLCVELVEALCQP